MGATRGTTKSLGSKDALDRFYTDEAEASRLLSVLSGYMEKQGKSLNDFYYLEPSAGAGAFVKAVEDRGLDIIAYDIAPSSAPICETEIVKQDFLAAGFSPMLPDDKPAIAIGNPPFGTKGSLAYRFVAKCIGFCDIVAFIMPPSACKGSAKGKTGDARMRCFYDVLCADYAVPGKDKIAVPSKFVIYTKISDDDLKRDAEKDAEDRKNVESLPFEFVSHARAEAAEKDGREVFSIRRVGGAAGSVRRTIDLSEQSNYFCVLDDGADLDEVEKALSVPIEERELSVGPRSLSKIEIARAIVARMNL